ncbi:DNA-binding protein [Patescibacteria group bacterium]|nr:MAG: DNA-binding protein [Patescibacteria group bacterium]
MQLGYGMRHQTLALSTSFVYACVYKHMSTPDRIIRVSVSEAARLFGVSMQTVRRAIADKEVLYVVVGNRYKINFESLVTWSQRSVTVRNKTERRGIGQFVQAWRIRNTRYSPNPQMFTPPPGPAARRGNGDETGSVK